MSDYLHSRETGEDVCCCGSEICSDCLECLQDPEQHCQQCGDHVDSLSDCQSGCDDEPR
jgi:hypothetical protein